MDATHDGNAGEPRKSERERTASAPAAKSADATSTRRATHSVTLSDVASLAKVSPQTVSRSIRFPDLVSESTLERVRWAIMTTGYVPNLAASSLASNRSMTVAAVIPDIAASVFADMLHGLESVLTPNGYQLFIGASGYDLEHEEELIRAFMGRRPDGFFIVGTKHTPAASTMLRSARIPIVEAWSWTDDPIDTLFGYSNSAAINSVVEHVVAKGYRHPTFAGSLQSGNPRAAERRASFGRAVGRLLPGEEIRVVGSDGNDNHMAEGIKLMDAALSRYPETDVLMFASDVFAAGAILECNRRGLDVPGTLAITGFGDYEVARHVVPRLTTVSLPNEEMGTRAGTALLARMTKSRSTSEKVDLGFSLLIREST